MKFQSTAQRLLIPRPRDGRLNALPRSPPIVPVLAAATLGLSACGGGDNPSGGSKDDQKKFEEAALKHARCLREHGIDAPDPKPGGGFMVRGKPGDEAKMKRAEADCKHFMDDAPPPKLSDDQKDKAGDQALAHAR